MNKYQKELIQKGLEDEKKVLNDLKKVYEQAEKDIDEKLAALLGRLQGTEDANLQQSIIYQRDYQLALKKQISGVLDDLNGNEFNTISEYIQKSYEDGFIGTIYDMQSQGVPLIFPIDQEQVTTAIVKDTKLSKSLYSKLGEDVADLKKRVQSELSRGIAQNYSYAQIAKNIGNQTKIGYNRAARIAQTEGHRVQQAAKADAQIKAKEAGADVVKQWDATLDGNTRSAHRELDGQIREVDKPFEVGLHKAQYPGGFGVPFLDINCRCTTLTRARWAVEDEDDVITKWDNEKGELIEIKAKDYQDFKEKYFETLDKTKKKSNNIGESRRKQSASRVGIKAVSDKTFDDLTIEAKKHGAVIMRGTDEVERHLDSLGADASCVGDVLFFRKDACISEVLEETYHFEQNRRGLNDDKPDELRTLLNEIDAKKHLIKVAKKYKIPRKELEVTRTHLAEYEKQLAEYEKRR